MARLRLDAELALDGRQFFGMMRTADRVGQQFATSFKSHVASAFSVTAIAQFTRHLLTTANAWEDMSDRLGVSLHDVQALEFSFLKAGLSASDAETAMLRLSKAVDEAMAGGKAAGAFERIGISLNELHAAGGDTAKIFSRVAEEFEGMDRATARGFARDLFGERAGEKFIAALSEFRKGGAPIVDDADLKAVSQMSKELELLKRQIADVGAVSALAKTPLQTLLNPQLFIGNIAGQMAARLFRGAQGQTTAPAAGAGEFVGPQQEAMFSPHDKSAFEQAQSLLKQQAALEEKILSIQQKMLPVGQQRVALEARINEKLAEADRLRERGEEASALTAAGEAATLLDQLTGLRREPLRQPQLNALQQIGGAGGDVADRLLDPARQQLNTQQQMLNELKQIKTRIEQQANEQL